jgi:hypothetical protein
MRIVLASSIILSFGNIEQPCENYEYAKDNAGHYVLMVGDDKPSRYDERLTSALLEIVKMVINIDDPALGSSFRDLWKFPDGTLKKALIQRNDEDENIWQEADAFFDGTVMPDSSNDTESKNRELFIKCRDDNFDKFKRLLYAKLTVATLNEQKMYLCEIRKYIQIEPRQESLQENHCNVLLLLQSTPPADLLDTDDNEIDVDAIGKETKHRLRNTFPQNTDELNGFLVNEYDSLLRFGNYDFLKTEFKKHLEKRKIVEETAASSPTTPKQPIVVDSSKLRLSQITPKCHKRDSLLNGGYIDYSTRQAQNINIGKLAERVVYDYLIGEYGESNVKWVSQFAKEENVNLDGSDGAGYDMEYFDSDTKYCVEVKTNGSRLPIISFNMTRTERSIAENNSSYQIFVVTEPKSDTPFINPFLWCDIPSSANTPTGYLVEFESKTRDFE